MTPMAQATRVIVEVTDMAKPTLEQLVKFGAAVEKARFCTTWIQSYEAEPIASAFEALFGDASVENRDIQKARATRNAVAEAMARALVADDRDTSDVLRRAMETATRALALAVIHAAYPQDQDQPHGLPDIDLTASIPPSSDPIVNGEAVQ